MTSIGAEVGQKMRSAIKAKLLELNCYVDDELPDYIMVMVANKRTKSQMKEDLQLFLTTKTSTFVEWLHIVLKKLKEVTVTNPEVYKKSSKRKSTEVPNVDLKKEKKEKKSVKKEKEKKNAEAVKSETADSTFKSLTDDLPISANKLSEQRKIIIMKENQSLNQNNNNNTTTSSTSATEQLLQDNFDIPPLSEVNMSTEEELETIERKIKSVKSRLGILVESEEDEDEEDYINLKAEPDELFNEEKTTTTVAVAVEPSSSSTTVTTTNNKPSSSRAIHMVDSTTTSSSLSKGLEPPTSTTAADNAETEATGPSSPAPASAKKRSEHTRITFENNKDDDDDRSDEDKSERRNSKKSKKRRSVLERLGKRRKHNRSDEEDLNKDEEAIEKDRDDGSRERRHKRDKSDTIRSKRNKISLSEIRKEEEKFLYNCGRSSGGASSSGRKSEEKSDSGSAGKGERKKDGERYKESVLSRLGVMSKVSVPLKPAAPPVPQLGEGEEEDGEEVEEPIEKREVPSVVKVRPRVIPPDAPQANKNLLLKAVAEAQKSIAQTPRVGINAKPDALFTKKYKEKTSLDKPTTDQKPGTPERSSSISSSSGGQKSSRLNAKKSTKQLSLFTDRSITLEYVPAPIGTHKGQTTPEYIPSSKSGTKSVSLDERNSENNNESAQEDDDEIDDGTSSDNAGHDNGRVKQQFIVTLDGIDKTQYKDLTTAASPIVTAAQSTDGAAGPSPPSIKTRLDKRRSPSPIIFDGVGSTTTTTTAKSKSNIPDKLPIVHPPPTLKNKERCKYWPTCRQGDKCEFVHPTTNCEMFPKCKFGDRCLYLHPVCKFGSSCTRRDCPYSHNPLNKNSTRLITAPAVKVGGLQTCKYFPNCANLSCNFYHPKPCRFGKHCKNQSECTFSHSFVSNRSSLTWRPK